LLFSLDKKNIGCPPISIASRLVAGQKDSKLLEDPDIEKKILIEGNASVNIDPDS